jgi:CubicO group peptidase (beta-lactamase class C family)
MQQFVDAHQVSGVVTLIASSTRTLHVAAVGTSDGTRKMRQDDLFWIASMSKPVTALSAALLVDDGKLSFDDPVEKFIPEFRNLTVGPSREAQARPIRVRDLLTHTSGLPEYSHTEPHWTLQQFTQQIASQPLRFQPGTRWQYSTAGLDAVGRIVEVASGMPFDQFMQKRLLDPLSMKETSFWIAPENLPRYAHTYRLNSQTHMLEETPIPYMYGTEVTDRRRAPLGGAGLFSTAQDIARIYQMALNHGAVDGRQILKPETLALMTRNQIAPLTARPGMP